MSIKDIKNAKTRELRGAFTVSPLALRRMANFIQKRRRTNGDVRLKAFICTWKDGTRTFGVEI